MPVFVFLSGVVFKFDSCLKHIKRYYVTYIVYAFVLSVVDYLVFKPDYTIASIVYNIVLWGGGVPHRVEASPALWFLTALIVIQALSSLLFLLYKRIKVIAIVLFIGLYVFAVWATKGSLFLPYNIITSIYLLPFFIMGILAGKYALPEILKRFSRISAIVIATLGLVIYFLSKKNGLINIFRCTYGKSIVLYNIAGALGCIFIYMLAVFIDSLKLKQVNFVFNYFGKNTVAFMCAHQLLYKILDETVVNRLNAIPKMCIYFVLAILVGLLCSKTIHPYINRMLMAVFGEKR